MLERFFFLDRRSITWLDGLRALAILLVVIRHVFDRPYHQLVGNQVLLNDALWLKLIAGFGWSGVTLFFMISGFLVGGSIVLDIQAGTFRWSEFALKRFMRVYVPAAVLLALVAVTNSWDLTSAASLHNFIFIANYTRDIWMGHYWSLAVEEHFYIFLPIAGLLFARNIRKESLLSLGVVILILAFGFSFFRLVAAQIDLVANSDDYYRLSHWQFDYFASGIAIRMFYEYRERRGIRPIYLGSLGSIFMPLIFVAIMIMISWYASNADGNSILRSHADGKASGITYFLNLVFFVALLLFVMTVRVAWSGGIRWLRLVAAISFSTYLVHIMILENTQFLYQPLSYISGPTSMLMAALIIGLGTCLVAGLVFFVLVERPILLLRDRVLGVR